MVKFGQSLILQSLIPIFIHFFAITVIQILHQPSFSWQYVFAHTRNQQKDLFMIPICLVLLLEGSCLFLLLQIPSNSLLVSLFQHYPLSYLIVHSNWTCEFFHAHMKYKTITKNDSYHKGFGIDSIYVVVNDEGIVFKKCFHCTHNLFCA